MDSMGTKTYLYLIVLIVTSLLVFGCVASKGIPVQEDYLFKNDFRGKLSQTNNYFEYFVINGGKSYNVDYDNTLPIVCEEYFWFQVFNFSADRIIPKFIDGLEKNNEVIVAETIKDVTKNYPHFYYILGFPDPSFHDKKYPLRIPSYSKVPNSIIEHQKNRDEIILTPLFYGYEQKKGETVLSVNFVFSLKGEIIFHKYYMTSFLSEEMEKSLCHRFIEYLINDVINDFRDEI